MFLINNLISILFILIDFNSSIISFLSNYIFEVIFIIGTIYFSTKKVKDVLDVTAKVVGIVAGTSVIHKNLTESSST